MSQCELWVRLSRLKLLICHLVAACDLGKLKAFLSSSATPEKIKRCNMVVVVPGLALQMPGHAS